VAGGSAEKGIHAAGEEGGRKVAGGEWFGFNIHNNTGLRLVCSNPASILGGADLGRGEGQGWFIAGG